MFLEPWDGPTATEAVCRALRERTTLEQLSEDFATHLFDPARGDLRNFCRLLRATVDELRECPDASEALALCEMLARDRKRRARRRKPIHREWFVEKVQYHAAVYFKEAEVISQPAFGSDGQPRIRQYD